MIQPAGSRDTAASAAAMVVWHAARKFTAQELRGFDALAAVMELSAFCQKTTECSEELSIVVAELFNNALDHGVLRLDSTLKLQPDGMDAYLAERQARLARLTEGEIEIAVDLCVAGEQRWLRVVCRDSGPGFRLQDTDAAGAGDASELPYGRGLMLVRALASALTQNEPGNEVTAILPLRSLHPDEPPNIMVVDDEPASGKLLVHRLERAGHRCILATSGEEAIELFAPSHPDLVLMDVMLPGIDGFETTRRLRRQQGTRWIPIIFLSALGDAVDIVSALDAGGDDFLTKPVDFELLLAKIEAIQRQVHLHRQLESATQELRRYYDQNESEKQLAVELMRHQRREGMPPIPGVDFATVAAIDFAGDIIAVEETPDGRLYMMLADATGHGLAAAINLFPAVETFYGMTAQGYDMASIISRINDSLRRLIPGHRFVSALFASLDSIHGTVEVWNAGIPAALLADADGSLLRRFPSRIIPLGIERISPADLQGEIDTMTAGQVLVAFSDGLSEATSSTGEAFGEHGLLAALPAVLSEDGCSAILRRLRTHAGKAFFADDVSLSIIRQVAPPRIFEREQAGAAPCRESDIGFSLVFGPEQLRRIDHVVPRFMNLARGHFELLPATFGRIFRVVRQLATNAIDWGLLLLPVSIADQSPEVRRRRRQEALAHLSEGALRMAIHSCRLDTGETGWEVVIEDSGPGFDGAAALARARMLQPCCGGLALAAAEALRIEFDPPGNRVRIWISD